jgi:hypothetical protein
MKKIILFALLAVTLAIAAGAGGDNNQLGMELRLDQLALSIERNIEYGEQVLEQISFLHPDADVARMEEILIELGLLRQEVDTLEGMTQDLSEDFIVIRTESIALTAEFKGLADAILTEEEVTDVRESLTVSEELKATARQKKNQYNALVLQSMFRYIVSEEDIQGLAQGRLSLGQVRQSIMTAYNNAGVNIKAMVKTQVQQDLQEHRQRPAEVSGIQQMLQNRAEERRELAQKVLQQNKISSGGNGATGSENSGGTQQVGNGGDAPDGASGSSSGGSSTGTGAASGSGTSGGSAGGSSGSPSGGTGSTSGGSSSASGSSSGGSSGSNGGGGN